MQGLGRCENRGCYGGCSQDYGPEWCFRWHARIPLVRFKVSDCTEAAKKANRKESSEKVGGSGFGVPRQADSLWLRTEPFSGGNV